MRPFTGRCVRADDDAIQAWRLTYEPPTEAMPDPLWQPLDCHP